MSRVATLLCTAAAAVCLSGCVGQPRQFTVETAVSADPLIYAPGTEPGEALSILVPGVRMSCSQRPVALVVKRPRVTDVPIAFTLTRRLVDQRNLGSEPVSVYARFSPNAYRAMADQVSPRSRNTQASRWPRPEPAMHRALAVALANDPCKLSLIGGAGDNALAASLAAQRILRDLPRAYSNVAAYAYNHQVTGSARGSANTANNGTSLDILPGMRLRVENSVPIPPAGINAAAGHPSSLAAPVFVYFNAVTRPQVCDVDMIVTNSGTDYLCNMNGDKDEQAVYLSPSAEMLRLGARQVDRLQDTNYSPQRTLVSNVVDLYEHADLGLGVWRHWRLWFPNSRPIKASTPFSDTDGGSADSDVLPVLIAAQNLAKLEDLTNPESSAPCTNLTKDADNSWRCYFMFFRAAPVPEIALRVNGVERWVPVGTTLHDLVAPLLHANIARTGNDDAAAAGAALMVERGNSRLLKRVSVMRQFDGVAYPVRPDTLDSGLASSRFLRLQLLPGDDISW